jgi:hypothetical protein
LNQETVGRVECPSGIFLAGKKFLANGNRHKVSMFIIATLGVFGILTWWMNDDIKTFPHVYEREVKETERGL